MAVPPISVVTPSFNQARYLEDTLRSVQSQCIPGLEHIVIDGGSTDGSVEILRRLSSSLSYWVSEPDRGQVHAINRGLALATGEVFAFLNSDDLFLPGALRAVMDRFDRSPDLSWLCGDVVTFGEGHPTRFIETRVPRSAAQCVACDYAAPQPGHFWRRGLLADGFDERWKYDFDHDLYIRLLLRGWRCERLPLPVAAYRLHSTSKTVAEQEGFEQDFEDIALAYEPALTFHGRRRSRATRHLRSIWREQKARTPRAFGLLAIAALSYPEGFLRRPFWACLRRLLLGTVARTQGPA